MQSLDIISVNLWQILISLANLFILFIILKKFLYKPVKRTVEERRAAIDGQYSAAAEAQAQADAARDAYSEKLSGANAEADGIVRSAVERATERERAIIDEANERAAGIIKRAEETAALERKKAEEDIKREIVEVSTLLSEKMLEREVSADDHRQLIDSFIEGIGSENEAN